MSNESNMNTTVTTPTPVKKHRKMSAETRAKMSAAKKGKILSAETKAKMSASKKGHKVSDATKAKMARSHRKTFIAKTGFGREQATALRNEYASRKTKTNIDGFKVTYQSLAEKYHISIAYVYAVLKNKVWKVRPSNVVVNVTRDEAVSLLNPEQAALLGSFADKITAVLAE